MKKIKYLLLILMALLVLPFSVFAEGEEEAQTTTEESVDKRVVVYFFRGEGCEHCADAEEWFDSIDDEIKEKFIIKDYETWYSEENSSLMKDVVEVRGEEETATGVPYIIIGDKSWVGFAENYKEEITTKINEMFDQEVSERYDVMTFVENAKLLNKNESTGSDIVSLIIIILVVGASSAGIYFARKQNAQ